MRGFRGNRAVQNQFSSRYGNQGVGTNYQRPVKDFRQGEGTPQPRPDLPDWLKTAETIAAEKGTAKAAAPAAPTPAPLRVIEGGAAKKTNAKASLRVIEGGAAKKTNAKAPAASGKKAGAPSKDRKVSAVSARKSSGRKAA